MNSSKSRNICRPIITATITITTTPTSLYYHRTCLLFYYHSINCFIVYKLSQWIEILFPFWEILYILISIVVETPERQSISPVAFTSPPSRAGILRSPPFQDEISGHLSRSPPLKIVRQEPLVSPLHARTVHTTDVDESFDRVLGKLNLKLSSHYPQPSDVSSYLSYKTHTRSAESVTIESRIPTSGGASISTAYNSNKMAEMMEAVDLKYQRLQQIASLDTYMDRRISSSSSKIATATNIRSTSITTDNIREIENRQKDGKST